MKKLIILTVTANNNNIFKIYIKINKNKSFTIFINEYLISHIKFNKILYLESIKLLYSNKTQINYIHLKDLLNNINNNDFNINQLIFVITNIFNEFYYLRDNNLKDLISYKII